MKKRLLLLLCLLTAAGSAAWAEIASGSCKRGSWVIDDSGKLTVNINGDMADYSEGKAPWYGYADQITAIHIGSACTNIGRNGFYGLSEVTAVTGGENVEACAMYSFEKCGGGLGDEIVPIPSIYFPKCSYVGECAFSGCCAQAISLPLVKEWKVAAIAGGTSEDYSMMNTGGIRADGSSYCDLVDLGSKVKEIRPGSLVGPYYVFCQNPTPPNWERLYDKDEASYAVGWLTRIFTFGITSLVDDDDAGFYVRDYEYPFGDHSSVKVIVPQNLVQTYIDYYRDKKGQAEGYMMSYFTGDHGKKADTKPTGKIVAGEPIYENGKLIGGWYVDDATAQSLHVFFAGDMPSYEGKAAPWTSLVSSNAHGATHMELNVGGKIPARAFKGGQALKGITYINIYDDYEVTIGDNAFEGCTDLVYFRDMTGGEKCKAYVGNSAFKGCTQLLHFGPEIRSLGTSAFEGCAKVGGFYYPLKMDVSSVPGNAFKGCIALHGQEKGVDLSKVRTIGKQAFYGCTGIRVINLSNCTQVGEEAFAQTGGVASIQSLTFGPSTYGCTFGSRCFAGVQPSNIFVSSNLDENKMPSDIFSGVTLSSITLHCNPELYGQCYENHAIFGKMKVDKVFTFPVQGSIIGGSADATWSLSSGGTLKIYNGGGYMPNYASNTAQPWYQYREYIRDVVLESVARIGKNNFSELPILRNVSIPRECTEISDNAFKNCPELKNIYITRVETLGNNVFEGCTSLKSIELGSKLKSVGDYVFMDCHSLNEIENITSTPATTTANSFASIKSEVYSLKGGPRKANDGGQSTVTLNVPDAYVTKYMTDPNWSKFHIAYADERGTWVKAGNFGDGMWVLYDDSTMVISASKNPSNTSPIRIGFMTSGGPKEGDAMLLTKKIEFAGTLTEVEDCGFSQFTNLESVLLCPSIKKIGEGAFMGGDYFGYGNKLKSINLENVEVIGKSAFSGMAFDLLDLTNVKEIGQSAFSDCPNLTTVTLGNNCKVGGSAFSKCKKLTVINMGEADLDNATACFSGCTGLRAFAYNGKRLPYMIVQNCTALEKVKLGSKVESIDWTAFLGCTALDTVFVDRATPPALPTGKTADVIGYNELGPVYGDEYDVWAFHGLTLKDIHLVVAPDYIPAYKGANIWKDMTIEGDTEAVEPELPTGGSLYGCGKDMYGNYVVGGGGTWYLDTDGTLTIDAPGAIAAYDRNGKPWCETFNAYVGLIKSIVVKDEVTSIPDNFFGGKHFAEASAGVETITLGEGLTVVGKNSLSFSGVKTVYIYSGEPLSLGTNVFDQDAAVQNNATLHVLSDAGYNRYLSHYKSHNSTKRFPNIVADLTQSDPKVEAVTFPITELTMYVDETINLYNLMPQFTPANVKNTKLRFNNLLTSANVYIDDDGNMRAWWEGKAYIEAWSSYTADGTELQALWGPDRASTYLKVTITEKPKPEQIFFDHIEGEGTDASWITCHVLKDEYVDAETQIRTCEIAGHFNEDDIPTHAIPEWRKGKVDIPEKPHDFEVVRIGAFSFEGRDITKVTIPWTATQIGDNAFARCYMLKDVYIPQPQPMTFTSAWGDVREPEMGHNSAFDRVGEDVGGATLHVPAGCVPAWNVYPWNEWFRFIVEDVEVPDGMDEIKSEELRIKNDESWFDMSGRKLGGKPMKAGLYIRNGKKVVIK